MNYPKTLVAVLALAGWACGGSSPADFRSDWPADAARPWAGADYWTNPWQDWRVRDGRLENHVAGGDRNAFLLTREVSDRPGKLALGVKLGRIEGGDDAAGEGFAGFRVGIGGLFDDYRDSAVRGYGMNAGLATDGRLFIGRLDADAPRIDGALADVALELAFTPNGDSYTAVLSASGPGGKASVSRDDIRPEWLTGGLALVSSSGPVGETPIPMQEIQEAGWTGKPGTNRGGATRFWFRDWTATGDKLDAHPDRRLGPILFAMHTLSRGKLTLTAQMAPWDDGPRTAALEVREGEAWKRIAEAELGTDTRMARFRIDNWDAARDTPYRVVYADDRFEGTVRRDPVDKPEIVVAAFTGNNDLGFPHADIVRSVQHHEPDFLAYTGDNIYERVGEYGIQRDPLDAAILDYLRKWAIFGWEYRDLLRDIPAVAIPDDHDVYQGNIWGAGGRRATEYGQPGQDQGGFTMHRDFVETVIRSQTSNLPDPFDPTPIEQNLPVYYTDLLYGGVSFAIIADRQWKSSPTVAVPAGQIVNGWSKNPRYDAARQGDVPGAELLGERQLTFLDGWTRDWEGAWMKSLISQTIFNNVATLPKGSDSDAIVPKLGVPAPGEYVEGDWPVQDHDSNAWPQSGRNAAVRILRKAQAFHIAGDQHLGSTIQYGVDDWNDSSWAICVPSVANIFPRRWFPPQPGRNRDPEEPRYSGEYLDGFGLKMTVHAVSNPVGNGIEPVALNHRAPGYGIVKFRRDDRTIDIANWPRWVDPSAPGAEPYEGWPITIRQTDNGLATAPYALPPVESATDDPVLQVVDAGGEPVYTMRIRGRSFTPRVWTPGTYSVKLDGQAVAENVRAVRGE